MTFSRGLVACLFLTFVTVAQAQQRPNPLDALNRSKVGRHTARFVTVPAGEFLMGSPYTETGRSNDEEQHTVRLTQDFEIQATEVTQLQYFLVMGRNPSIFVRETDCDRGSYQVVFGLGMCTKHPVENVTRNDVLEFITELNRIQNTHTYRLPTEAEWEYAARDIASPGFPYPFGYNETGLLNTYAWFSENANERTHTVALRRPSQHYGLYDMYGNVSEWVQDYYDYYTTNVTQVDPMGPDSGYNSVIRGGAYDYYPLPLRTANRTYATSTSTASNIGFRLVRTLRPAR